MSDIAVVTGAAGALGAAVARALRRRDRRVILVDREANAGRLEKLSTELGEALCVTGDIASDATWSGVLDRSRRDFAGLPSQAALIAGTWLGGAAVHEEKDDSTFRTMMTANVETTYRGLRALLPAMVGARHGSVVVVGSRAAEQPGTSARAASYAASKAAVVAMARAVAAEVLEHGVRVNAILPSTMDTPANRAAMPQVDPGRWVSLESVAGVVEFLLGDGARDISGAALPVYGRS